MVQKTDGIIIRTIARVLVPFIQIYALYVIMHGHYSPGGGFQGGVILGASLVLLILTHGAEETRLRIGERAVAVLSSAGVVIYAGIGALCLVLMGKFLDYGRLSGILNVPEPMARSLGILGVEIGVAFAVMAVMFSIFYNISIGGTNGKDDQGAGEEE